MNQARNAKPRKWAVRVVHSPMLFTRSNWKRCESNLMLAAFAEALAGNASDPDTRARFQRARTNLDAELHNLVRRKADTKAGRLKRASN